MFDQKLNNSLSPNKSRNSRRRMIFQGRGSSRDNVAKRGPITHGLDQPLNFGKEAINGQDQGEHSHLNLNFGKFCKYNWIISE